jgi:hypothetical protein
MWIKLSRNNEVPEHLCQRSSRGDADTLPDPPTTPDSVSVTMRTGTIPHALTNIPGDVAYQAYSTYLSFVILTLVD